MDHRQLGGRALRAWPIGAAALIGLALLLAQCRTGEPAAESTAKEAAAKVSWGLVYEVLLHPRCANCHPAGDVPLQGDEGLAHGQNVQRGPEGKGQFALRCDDCHLTRNQSGPHLPPGAPSWHMPHPDVPLVFTGRGPGELCRQLRDPAHNGGRTPEQVYEHMAQDPLVLWGWDPGEGRTPVTVPHDELLRALRAWIDGGCACPD
jgi:hypothetical protein